jgi:hypothetical protein
MTYPLFVRSALLRGFGSQLWQTAEQTSAGLNAVYGTLAGPALANPGWRGCAAVSAALAACDGRLTGLATSLSELSRSIATAADAYDTADDEAGRRHPSAGSPS